MGDTWDAMVHWDLVLPPSRPSHPQLECIRATLQNVDRAAPVAVLGSTPEFRDLLHECHFRQIYVLDKNRTFYGKMSNVRIYRNPEIFLHGEWLELLPQHSGKFSVILSDLTSGNIPYTQRGCF